MRLRDIDTVAQLRDQLTTINKQIKDLWKFSNHESTAHLYGSSAADQAEGAAKKAIRGVLIKQRNATLDALQVLGITLEEE